MKFVVNGTFKGKIIKSNVPINFLSDIDRKKGFFKDTEHNLFNTSIKDKILVFPYGIGSSVGAYIIYSLYTHNVSPIAMICKKADLIVASGCAIANIPLVILCNDEYNKLHTDMIITINELNNLII